MERLDKVQEKNKRKEKIYKAIMGCGVVGTVAGLSTMVAATGLDSNVSNQGLTMADHLCCAGAIVAGTSIGTTFLAWVKNGLLKEQQEDSLER